MGLRRHAPFRSRRGGAGRVAVNLDASERLLVAQLLDEVAAMLEDETVEPGSAGVVDEAGASDLWSALEASLVAEPPSDPAVARLLPDGSRSDPEIAQSFRRLTEHSLRARKCEALGVGAAALRRPDPLELTRAEVTALLKALTDLRLVLAERLGIRTDEDAESLHERLWLAEAAEPDPAEEHWFRLAAVYEAITGWQASLVEAAG